MEEVSSLIAKYFVTLGSEEYHMNKASLYLLFDL